MRRIIMRGIRMFGPGVEAHEGILLGRKIRVIHEEIKTKTKQRRNERSEANEQNNFDGLDGQSGDV